VQDIRRFASNSYENIDAEFSSHVSKVCMDCRGARNRQTTERSTAQAQRREAIAKIIKRHYSLTNTTIKDIAKEAGTPCGDNLIRKLRGEMEEDGLIPKLEYRLSLKSGRPHRVRSF